eukprot:GHVH01014466.1.p1 GENE.GHVH01014466.1~~GHVH01014466.1.p1  ORF type:complete len:390 (+),score=35.15 GHVH01014466.1:519-1688(+)
MSHLDLDSVAAVVGSEVQGNAHSTNNFIFTDCDWHISSQVEFAEDENSQFLDFMLEEKHQTGSFFRRLMFWKKNKPDSICATRFDMSTLLDVSILVDERGETIRPDMATKDGNLDVTGAILNFIPSMMGCLLLVTPKAFADIGILPALCTNLLAATVVSISFSLLSYCVISCQESIVQHHVHITIGTLAEIYGGVPLRLILGLVEILVLIGAGISVLIMTGRIFSDLFKLILATKGPSIFVTFFTNRKCMSAFTFTIVMLPLSLLKNIGLLRYSSGVSIAVALVTIIVISLFLIPNVTHLDPCRGSDVIYEGSGCMIPTETYYESNPRYVSVFFQVSALQLSGYNGTPQICVVYNNLKVSKKNSRSMITIVCVSVGGPWFSRAAPLKWF